MTKVFTREPTQYELTKMKLGLCPYCPSREELQYQRAKHTENDMEVTCPRCERSFLECYDITGYLMEKKDETDAKKNKVLNQILYGDIDSLVTQQACDHLQLNPTVDQLDDEQRIRVGAAMAVANWLENLDDC